MQFVILLGRILFAAIFILASPRHFSSNGINHASELGVPLAQVLVPISGVLAALGGLSVLLGYRAKLGAWMLVVFLVAVTLMMHQFWKISDPTLFNTQRAMFMKNLSMLGAALLITQVGAGPLSVDGKKSETTVLP